MASAGLLANAASAERTVAQAASGMARVSDGPDAALPPVVSQDPETLARNEAHWRDVAAFYRVTDRTTNLEAGFFGMMASPVLAAYHEHIDRVNRESSYFARRGFPAMAAEAQQRVANALGVSEEEIGFSRNATEALQALISQYLGVSAGDTVMYADLDYNAMQWAMNALAERRGAHVVTLAIPEPATARNVVAVYEEAFAQHPRTKLLLLTHCNNKTGLILPVRTIADLARARGIDVIVDAAHSFGQVPLSLPDLGADFVGVNLHKWVGAPVGVGAMYIRRERLGAIDRAPGEEGARDRISSRLHTGTSNFAAIMTVPDALDFQDRIGVANKSARLRYLRDTWAIPSRSITGVTVLTPDDRALVGALTGLRMHGRGARDANAALTRRLLDEFGLFTVARSGLANGDCVRITPALYNTPDDAARLVSALEIISRDG